MWAIECESTATQVFRINNQDAAVFTDVCDAIFKLVIDACTEGSTGQQLPPKDQVQPIS